MIKSVFRLDRVLHYVRCLVMYRYLALMAIVYCAVACFTICCADAQPVTAPERIAVLGALPPITDSGDAAAISATLRAQGHDVAVLSAVQLTDAVVFNAARYHLLIIPHSDVFPQQAERNVGAYIHSKGRLICLGGPAFSRRVYTDGKSWMSLHDRLAAQTFEPLFDLKSVGVDSYARASLQPDGVPELSIEDSPHGPALSVNIAHYKGWSNASPPKFVRAPFPPGCTLTSFWAKGDGETDGMVMEWVEVDGSRWIATIALSAQWKQVVLSATDFHYWPDSSTPKRGGSKDRLNCPAVSLWRFGLADSHARQLAGPHRFWIADLQTAAMPFDIPATSPEPLVLEGLTPLYKQAHDVTRNLWLPIMRDRGIGIAGTRTARLLPVDLTAPAYPTANSEYAQWVRVALSGPFSGAIWGGVADYVSSTPAGINAVVRRALQNVFIVSAGAERPVYHLGEPLRTGVRLVNLGPRNDLLWLEQRIERVHSAGKDVTLKQEGDLTLPTGGSLQVEGPTANTSLPVGEYRFTVRLYQGKGGLLLDRIEMPVRIVPEHRDLVSPDQILHAVNGEFVVAGRAFRPVGVNYWPLTVAGQDTPAYFSGWLSPDQYDPDLVEQDIVRGEAVGINLYSVQYTRADEAPALIDFLARCRNHHALVNVFVAEADPRSLNEGRLRALIDAAGLRNCPDLFAFDIAWEPHLGTHRDRAQFDPAWSRWVQLNYGSVEAAEADWGVAAPRAGGGLTNPEDSQVAEDGPARRMVAAYRRFVDDMLSAGYRTVCQTMHLAGVDAMIGARSGYGGNGFPGVDSQMPFDLLAGAAHLDFISPEGYGLSGDWSEFRQGGFTAAYGRWAGGGKPVFWAEFGTSIFPGSSVDALSQQAEFTDKMLRTIVDSGSNGGAIWWYPGGLRIDEGSDFGIFDPDGAARPAALRIKSFAEREIAMSNVNATADSAAFIVGDRDADARGYTGLNMKLRSVYGALRVAGKHPTYRTAGTGTNTRSMPLIAVGNVPANGHNPLKYANAEIFFDPSKPTTLVLLNTGEAAWSRRGAGAVVLHVRSTDAKGQDVQVPLPDGSDVGRFGSIRLKIGDYPQIANLSGSLVWRLAVEDRVDAPGGARVLYFGEERVVQRP